MAVEHQVQATQKSEPENGHKAAAPQMLNGKGVYPEYWGMTREQCSLLLSRLREDESWSPKNNMYTLVTEYLKKWTAGTGNGYALLVNKDDPKEVNVMVSHAWSENAEEFLETVIRSTSMGDVLFICAFAIYQCEDGHGPSIEDQLGTDPEASPFARVLQHISTVGNRAPCWQWQRYVAEIPTVFALIALAIFLLPVISFGCYPGWDACHYLSPIDEEVPCLSKAGPVSLAFAIAAISLKIWLSVFPTYNGRMIVVPNREDDIYTRLWCVYEVFVATSKGVSVQLARTLASMGLQSSREAKCWKQEDMDRIRGDIQSCYGDAGFDLIDKAVKNTRSTAYRSAAFTSLKAGIPLMLLNTANTKLFGDIWPVSCELIGYDDAATAPFLSMKIVYSDHHAWSEVRCPFIVPMTGLRGFAWNMSYLITLAFMFAVFRSYQGRPCKRYLRKLCCKLLGSSVLLTLTVMAIVWMLQNVGMPRIFAEFLGSVWSLSTGCIASSLNVLLFLVSRYKCCFHCLQFTGAVIWLVFLALLMWASCMKAISPVQAYTVAVQTVIFCGSSLSAYAVLVAMTKHWGIVAEDHPSNCKSKGSGQEQPGSSERVRLHVVWALVLLLALGILLCTS